MSSHLRRRKTKDGYSWQIIIELEQDPVTGKRNRIFKTVPDCTKKEAEKIMRGMLSELDNKTFVRDSGITVAEFLSEWLNTYIKPHKSPTTIRGYEANINNYIIPAFGKVKLQNLTAIDIQKFYNELKKESPLSGKAMSPKSIRNIHMNLNAALKKAVMLEIIKKNPAEYIELERCKQYQAKVYDSVELRKLCEAVKGADLETGIMILIWLGLRRGELMGLKWEHIDFNNSTVNISSNVVQVNTTAITKEPKTESSKRKIDAPAMLMELLRREKTDYLKRKLKYGAAFRDTSLVICQPDGKPYKPASFTNKFKRFLEKGGLKHIRLHDLRHTNATMMLKLGISPKVAQKRLGHSNYSTTMDIYSHVLEEVERDAVEKLEAGLQEIIV